MTHRKLVCHAVSTILIIQYVPGRDYSYNGQYYTTIPDSAYRDNQQTMASIHPIIHNIGH